MDAEVVYRMLKSYPPEIEGKTFKIKEVSDLGEDSAKLDMENGLILVNSKAKPEDKIDGILKAYAKLYRGISGREDEKDEVISQLSSLVLMNAMGVERDKSLEETMNKIVKAGGLNEEIINEMRETVRKIPKKIAGIRAVIAEYNKEKLYEMYNENIMEREEEVEMGE